jgi:hypothetical protein
MVRIRNSATQLRRLTAELEPIALSKPALGVSRSFGSALKLRRTTREIGPRPLSKAKLSALLWAAGGVNRKDGPFKMPGRTAASASNSQEIDIYVVLPAGIYFYNPFAHALLPAAAGDFRRLAINRGQASIGIEAPVRLVYAVDIDRLTNTRGFKEPGLKDPEVQRSYYFVDTGLIAANVYLYAASVGLAAWFHNCDRLGLARKLRLPDSQRVLFAQTIGYPIRQRRGPSA